MIATDEKVKVGPHVRGGDDAGAELYFGTDERSAMKTEDNERAVVVTTAHKGVFFGYAKETSGPTIKLNRARLCVYWSADLRGFMGLAAAGPNSQCRIGPAADIELRDITAVVECSPEAIARWEKSPWQ